MHFRSFLLLFLFALFPFLLLFFSFPILSVHSSLDTIPVLDGLVSPGEYFANVSFGDSYQLFWSFNDTTIFFAMQGKCTGWVALGLEPTDAMKDADMIFGWVSSSGAVSVVDAYSTGTYGPHPPDTDLGGTFDILAFNGSESDGYTTIEFVRLLDTGDQYDKPISPDTSLDIIWAISNSDDMNSGHTERGGATIDLTPTTPTSTSTSTTPGSTTNTTPTKTGFSFLATIILSFVSLATLSFFFLRRFHS